MLTCDLDVWHVMEFEHHKMDTSSYGQFYEGDTYVIRWRYNVNQLCELNLVIIKFLEQVGVNIL